MILLRLPGEAREVFTTRLRERLPLRAERVLRALEETRGAQGAGRTDFGERMRGRGARWDLVYDTFTLHARRLGFESTEEELEGLAPEVDRATQGELFS